MTDNPWLAAAIALFAWWFATGAILWRVRVADNGDAGQHRQSVFLGSPLLIGGAMLAWLSADVVSVHGTYAGFVAALSLWGWIELAFLSGVITGPNRSPCPPGAQLPQRFWSAVGTIAWHELALVLTLLALALIATANPIAAMTFALLLIARISAQLNLFFGVPRINTQFIPAPLRHLTSYFRQSRPSPFFPFSVLLLAATTHMLLRFTLNASTPATTVGFALLTTVAALALLEHLFMVLPLPDEKLWRWMMPAAKPQKDQPLEDANGL